MRSLLGVNTADLHRGVCRIRQETIARSVFNDMLHDEMQRTFEHAEKYGWGV